MTVLSRYGWLDTRYPVANTVRVIALKTVLDQTLLTIPLLLVFFPYMSWCQVRPLTVCHNIFFCEDAAQQVLMSVSPCVANLKFQAARRF